MSEQNNAVQKVVEKIKGNPRIGEYGIRGMTIGACIGAIIGLLIITTIPFPLNILAGLLAGAFVGLISGWIVGFMPEGSGYFILILILFFGIYMLFITGLATPLFYALGPTFESTTTGFSDIIKCIGNPTKCIWEPYAKGWGTETKAEDVTFKIDYETKYLYDDGKESEVEAKITVINKADSGVDEFTVYPECFIDNAKIETETESINFIQMESPQIDNVQCIVPSSAIKNKEDVVAKIKMIRPAKSSVSWTAVTLTESEKRKLASEGKKIPGEGENSGQITKYSTLPYSLELGVIKSLPLTDDRDEYEMDIRLITSDEDKGKLKEVTYLSVSGGGNTVYIESCEGLKKAGADFVLENPSTKKEFECTLKVEPENKEERVVFNAEIEYTIEIEKSQFIKIFKEEKIE